MDEVTVSTERLNRMLKALSMVALQEFEAAAEHLGPMAEDPFGELEGALEVFVSELEQATSEANQATDQLERLVVTQERAIRALSTPIIDVWSGVLTLPVIGELDERRTREMTGRLLSRIVETGARCVIIDMTGVDMVDTMTASHLVGMTGSAQMLGCYCVITGIGPDVATTLSNLGISFGDIRTLRTLQDGLRHCIAYLQTHRASF